MYGKAGLQEFSEEAVKRPDILKLTKKVRVSADEALSAAFPDMQAAVVTIKTKGRLFTERVDFPKGEPENPMTDEEFHDRYDDLMEYGGVNSSVSREVFGTVYKENATVGELVKNL